jgi:acyl-coenzyme A thioesterase PaaI-like protein
MGRTLGIRLVEAERGRVVFEGAPDRSVYNPMGGVHGGYAATMLDSACGVAVASALGEGRLISLGRRVAFSEASLVDGDGRLCAMATSTLLVFEAASGQRGAFHR